MRFKYLTVLKNVLTFFMPPFETPSLPWNTTSFSPANNFCSIKRSLPSYNEKKNQTQVLLLQDFKHKINILLLPIWHTSFLIVLPRKKRSVGRDSNGSGGSSSRNDSTTCPYGATTSFRRLDIFRSARPKSATIQIAFLTWALWNLKAFGWCTGITWSLPPDRFQYLDFLRNSTISTWNKEEKFQSALEI